MKILFADQLGQAKTGQQKVKSKLEVGTTNMWN